jgi:RNA 3'-terminal phosphate cyclase
MAADELIKEIQSGGRVDTHLADQLLVYVAQYRGVYTVDDLSQHARTMHWLLGEFGYHLEITENETVEVSA